MAITKRMGFEGLLYRGSAGTTAATQVTNSRDITESFSTEQGETTERGDGSAPPITYKRITGRNYNIRWNMTEDSGDASLTAFKAAAAAGTPVAIRTKSYSSGLGVDGDVVIVSVEQGKPLKGESTVDITAEPNNDNRAFQFNV
jgi:hypothetical protein